ncbi:antiporter inner membrane protein [Aedoeadaptatus ivorii]|uniref:Iron-sulfur cluster carrier protein n=1 Tax=Aedoeadaptatus ivorii TaxID=54006 RepID=A0A448V008_9FIRM|nr:Mrp/NBP35 family ATP-binding protein [Peptoniphilus ivorii]VEJ34642.1 antiporter inner membrane protein [Peptoniphilus ivorii]
MDKKQSLKKPLNEHSKIDKAIAVLSGKGGVGKSMFTGLLSSEMRRRGHSVGVLDADILGPSIPKIFGADETVFQTEKGIRPIKTSSGLELMSVNLILESPTDPVLWRAPVVGNMLTTFWSDVYWGEKDYLFVDMPPGTGDVALTVFQTMDIDGIVIVTSPQDLVSMIVEKALNMAKMMGIPVVGIVENMSYFVAPDTGVRYDIFGKSKTEAIAKERGIPFLGALPIDPKLAEAADGGSIEYYQNDALQAVGDALEAFEKRQK